MGKTGARKIGVAAVHAISNVVRGLTSRKDFCKWEEEQFPRVMFFEKTQRGKYAGYCECGETVEFPTVKGGEEGECPACGRRVVYRSTRYPYYGERKVLSALERHGDGLLQRIFVAHKAVYFESDGIKTDFEEDEEGRYYFDFADAETVCYHLTASKAKWSRGRTRVHGMGWSGWRADAVDTDTFAVGGWDALISGTSWQYSAVQIACEKMKWQPLTYLEWYFREPKLESLLKIGLYGLVGELTDFYGDNRAKIRELRSPKKIGIITAEDYRECAWLRWDEIKARNAVKTWRIKAEQRKSACRFCVKMAENHGEDFKYAFVSNERLFTYWDEQSAKKQADDNPGVFIRDYADYVRECEELKLNLSDTAIRTPNDFAIMHERTSAELKAKKNAVVSRKIKAFYSKVHKLVEWTDGIFSVFMPSSAEAIIREGKEQHHCVGGYCDRVAARKSVILFIRKNSEKKVAFVTMEILPDFEKIEIVQTRAAHNAEPSADVKQFLEKYKKWFNHRSITTKAA